MTTYVWAISQYENFWDCAPDPDWGANSASPYHLAGAGGVTPSRTHPGPTILATPPSIGRTGFFPFFSFLKIMLKQFILFAIVHLFVTSNVSLNWQPRELHACTRPNAKLQMRLHFPNITQDPYDTPAHLCLRHNLGPPPFGQCLCHCVSLNWQPKRGRGQGDASSTGVSCGSWMMFGKCSLIGNLAFWSGSWSSLGCQYKLTQ